MMIAYADIHTEQPERLMKRLGKHWGHKFPVETGEQESTITLPLGICHMFSTDILRVELRSDEQQLPTICGAWQVRNSWSLNGNSHD